jgi:hypothetical protein
MSHAVLRSRFAQNVVPLATSLAVHAAIVVVGVLAFRTLVVLNVPELEVQASVPDTGVMTTALPLVGIAPSISGPHPRLEMPEERPALGDFSTQTPAALELGDDQADASPDILLIGIESSAFPKSAETGHDGTRRGNRFGVPEGDPGGTGIFTQKGGPGVEGGGVRSVAYVCDASGSMIDKFDALRRQLDLSVSRLKPVQSFNVIFFHDQRAAALSAAGLVQGLTKQKRRAAEFLNDVIPSGATDPLPALELALRQQPDLIWLLTDGDFPDNEGVLKFLRQRNPNGKVRINTIAFVDRGEGYEQVLRQIAAENRGEFRFVGEDDLD